VTIKNYTPSQATQITTVGHNEQGQFSPSGEKIIYVSSHQPNHSHPQVYEMNLSTKQTLRLTYQDGHLMNPVYLKEGQSILYSSTTDENKENPVFLSESLGLKSWSPSNSPASGALLFQEAFLPTELYWSDPSGVKIRRLTFRPGFDGQISAHPAGSSFVFSSLRKKHSQLFSYSLNKKKPDPLFRSQFDELYPHYSLDGKRLTWVRKEKGVYRIMVADALGRTPQSITTRNATYHSPKWHPKGEHILFSANTYDANFELYVSRSDGSCTQRLTYTRFDEGQPHFSPDGSKILFTSNKEGHPQLFTMPFLPPETCPEQIN
jgi:Tol biopolymer transport system component